MLRLEEEPADARLCLSVLRYARRHGITYDIWASSRAGVHHGVWRRIHCQQPIQRNRRLMGLPPRQLRISVRMRLSGDYYCKLEPALAAGRDDGAAESAAHAGTPARPVERPLGKWWSVEIQASPKSKVQFSHFCRRSSGWIGAGVKLGANTISATTARKSRVRSSGTSSSRTGGCWGPKK